jgi:hypothetical protein
MLVKLVKNLDCSGMLHIQTLVHNFSEEWTKVLHWHCSSTLKIKPLGSSGRSVHVSHYAAPHLKKTVILVR